ncbi:trigger factor [Gehongia tenuis]|uniref:Trigger factor n=1 Tax=Gehongia tenuis TaxID=2763655 RepID=A0A926D3V2_9FIRM|nr:trigger factor [Gehongia tenuis]MBC8530833.1 trigger factor [Gehongia tenuis]
MKSTIEKLDKNDVKLNVEIEGEVFKEAVTRAYRKNVKDIMIPGFRRGKAPQHVIEMHYGKDVFYDEALNDVVPEAYDAAVEENELFPVDRPNISVEKYSPEEGVVFTAIVTVKPEVKLGAYKGIEVERVSYTVTDEDVDRQLKAAQDRVARWVDVTDRPVENGDRVVLDFEGYVDGEKFEGGAAENHTLDVGSGQFIPGFEEQLVGMKVDEEKDVTVTFPEEYHAKELAGKPAVFKCKIHSIKVKELPELDDEFAKDVSEFDTLDAYKADIQKHLEEDAERRTNLDQESLIIQEVVKNAEIDVPDCMVERAQDRMVQEARFRLSYQGIKLEDYLTMIGSSIEDFKATQKDEALNRVKVQLTLEAIEKAEEIVVTEEDLKAEMKKVADSMGKPVEEYEKSLRDEDREYMEDEIKYQKVIDLLKDNAALVEPKADKEGQKEEA